MFKNIAILFLIGWLAIASMTIKIMQQDITSLQGVTSHHYRLLLQAYGDRALNPVQSKIKVKTPNPNLTHKFRG